MSDRYLFRGKRVDNRGCDGEWVIGYYCHLGHTGKEQPYIIPDFASAFYGFQVDPATVGQCTGLKDVYSNMVFEGDTVRLKRLAGECEFKVFYNAKEAAFYFDEKDGCVSPVANWIKYYTWEVVDKSANASKEKSE